ncbi:unnamed protein product [Phytophthora fragariaefolia]|uniref:Unnamed protein product n=1 Tax=Phytophthora fragariaefolia TaxID=1490495 RepID=A0A9W6Y2Q8_9STRA|nr:unnamed protein product [Phytophthora fragariaefolia]
MCRANQHKRTTRRTLGTRNAVQDQERLARNDQDDDQARRRPLWEWELLPLGVQHAHEAARKGLLEHVQEAQVESEITEACLVNDAKALGIIAQGVEPQQQTKIRSATRAIEAWGTLREFYNRTTLHNHVTMTRRLHEFKMDNGASMAKHLDAFDARPSDDG